MAGSVNKVILVGNLGKDPEVRRMQNGSPVVNLTLATSESWRDKSSGERKEKTEWHRIVVFNEGLCKVVEQYCQKGQKLYIEGALQTRKWTDPQGIEKYSTEVVLNGYGGVLTMLDKPAGNREGESTNEYAEATGRAQPARGAAGSGLPHSDMDDDIPFAMEWR